MVMEEHCGKNELFYVLVSIASAMIIKVALRIFYKSIGTRCGSSFLLMRLVMLRK